MAHLQCQLDAAKDDNGKVTAMLQHVLSHTKMQAGLDAVQTELGHKDMEISNLRQVSETDAVSVVCQHCSEDRCS